LRNTFNLTVGYSDHTLGIEAAILSLAFGARIIEKHFTLDNTKSSFRDHQLSANPEDLRRLSEVLHKYEEIVGDGEKNPSPAELEGARVARRSIVAARDLEAGTILALADLAYVRPRNGLPPSATDSLIGRKLRRPLRQHEVLLGSSLE
jgi:N,N'-diacetyllegionaminate synthase